MNNLTLGNILDVAKNSGMTLDELRKIPVYLGDDEELNGIHTAFFVNIIDANNVGEDSDADNRYFIEMINEMPYNIELTGKGILIS